MGVLHDIIFRGISTVDLGVSYGITLCGNWVVCAMLLPEEGVFTQPYSISYGSTLWLKRNATDPNSFYMLMADYTFFFIGLPLCWFSLGSSMVGNQDSYRESCPSSLSSYKSLAQEPTMLESRPIPVSETRHFGLKISDPRLGCSWHWSVTFRYLERSSSMHWGVFHDITFLGGLGCTWH